MKQCLVLLFLAGFVVGCGSMESDSSDGMMMKEGEMGSMGDEGMDMKDDTMKKDAMMGDSM